MRISGRFWWQSERRIDPELDVAVWQLVVREAEEGLETARGHHQRRMGGGSAVGCCVRRLGARDERGEGRSSHG